MNRDCLLGMSKVNKPAFRLIGGLMESKAWLNKKFSSSLMEAETPNRSHKNEKIARNISCESFQPARNLSVNVGKFIHLRKTFSRIS